MRKRLLPLRESLQGSVRDQGRGLGGDAASAVQRLVAFALVCLFLGMTGCSGDFSPGPFPPEVPPLLDPIPFDDIAPGKIVFQRIGPPGERYIGVYIVDIALQRSLDIRHFPTNEPSISPDGESVAFTTYTTYSTADDIYVMNVDATYRRWVSDLEGRERSPSWTFDGKSILFFSAPFTSGGDSVQLYRQLPVAQPTDRGLVIDLGKQRPMVRVQGPVSASSTGNLLVAGDGIRVIRSSDTTVSLLVPPPGGGRTLYSPVWSPDEESFAALSVTRDAGRITSVSILLFAPDGTGEREVIRVLASGAAEPPGNNNYCLCWSPDGSQIAFTRPDGKETGAHIYIVRKDGSGLVQMTSAVGVTDKSISWGKESELR